MFCFPATKRTLFGMLKLRSCNAISILILFFSLFLFFKLIEQLKIAVTLESNSSNVSGNLNKSSLKMEPGAANIAKETTSNSTVLYVSPRSLNFLINPEDLCLRGTKDQSKLSLVILVCSAVSHADRREAIRSTWGSIAAENNNSYDVRLGFLFGLAQNALHQQQLLSESEKYADIIQSDFVDTYRNLTYKVIMLLRWVYEYCPNAQYVMKTDDDMFINVPNLINTLIRLPVKSNILYGNRRYHAVPVRDEKHRWYVSKTQYGEGKVLPDYVTGTGYVMTRDVVPKLLDVIGTIPYYPMEDIFITGLCANKTNVEKYNIGGLTDDKRPSTGCAFKDVIAGHHVEINDMKKIWKELHEKPLNCS